MIVVPILMLLLKAVMVMVMMAVAHRFGVWRALAADPKGTHTCLPACYISTSDGQGRS